MTPPVFIGLGKPPKIDLFNHVIRSHQHVRWNSQADLLSCFQIDDQLELRWLLHRQIGGLGAFEDFVDVDGGASEHVGQTRSVGYEASGLSVLSNIEHGRQPAFRCQVGDSSSVTEENRIIGKRVVRKILRIESLSANNRK
jgi:hypothetical protein